MGLAEAPGGGGGGVSKVSLRVTAVVAVAAVALLLVAVAALVPTAPPSRRQPSISPGERMLRLQISRLEDQLETAAHLQSPAPVRSRQGSGSSAPLSSPSSHGAQGAAASAGTVRFLLVAGLANAGQGILVAALMKTVPGRVHCDQKLEQLLQSAAIEQGSSSIEAYDEFQRYAEKVLASASAEGARFVALNGCDVAGGRLFPASVASKARKAGSSSLEHVDPVQLEGTLQRMGSDLAVVYVQDDSMLTTALQADPGNGRAFADNLRILAFFLLQLKAPVGCISLSHPTDMDAESVLQALSLFPTEELAPKLLANMRQLSPPPGNIVDDGYPAWAHNSIFLTSRQIAAACGNLSVPSFPGV